MPDLIVIFNHPILFSRLSICKHAQWNWSNPQKSTRRQPCFIWPVDNSALTSSALRASQWSTLQQCGRFILQTAAKKNSSRPVPGSVRYRDSGGNYAGIGGRPDKHPSKSLSQPDFNRISRGRNLDSGSSGRQDVCYRRCRTNAVTHTAYPITHHIFPRPPVTVPLPTPHPHGPFRRWVHSQSCA